MTEDTPTREEYQNALKEFDSISVGVDLHGMEAVEEFSGVMSVHWSELIRSALQRCVNETPDNGESLFSGEKYEQARQRYKEHIEGFKK